MDVFTGQAPIGAALQARRHDDAIAVDATILLHEDGIGASGHRCAGENTRRFTGLDCMRGSVTGSNTIDNDETPLARGIKVLGADRIAIHRGIVERRQIDRRDDIRREHPAERCAQRRRFAAGNRGNALTDQPLGLRDR